MQLDEAENDDDVKLILAVDEIAGLVLETGYRKPFVKLTMADKSELKAAMVDYHCMIKVKAAMDQYLEGLQNLKVLELVRKFPSLSRPFFIADNKRITAGGYKLFIDGNHRLYLLIILMQMN